MVTVPRETPSLPLMLRDYLAQYIWKSLGKSFFASEQRACQISLSLLSFCEAENIFAALVLNSASEAARGAEVQLLLRTRCLQLQVLELCDLWEHTGAALCGDSVRRGLRSWQGGTGIHNNTARVVFYCSELTLTLFVFIVGAFFGLYFLICKVGVGITGLHKKWILMM